jgi:hypothetical protein
VCCFQYLEIHYTAYNYVRVKVGYVQHDTIMRIFPIPETSILHSTFRLTPHSIVLIETLIVAQLIKKSLLRNIKAYYYVHINQPSASKPGKCSLTPTSCFFKIYFNIIRSCMPRSSKLFIPFNEILGSHSVIEVPTRF